LIQAAIPRTVALHLALQENLPAIEADVSQIQQLVMNLVINGAEAIPEGTTGTVTIVTRQQQLDQRHVREHGSAAIGKLKPGPYVVLEVRDTGSGMDEATMATIFDPFFTTKFTGRGLGLAAVLGIVRGHSGAIEVVSAPAQGTVFRVLFPALAVVPDHQPQQCRDIRDLSGQGTVLVIDDEQIVRSMAKRALEHFGYSVLLAEDGERGLELFRQGADHIQCVVLDMTMPVMSGEETLSRLRALSSDIPVILSSGFNEAEAMRRFEGKDLAGFVQKPYTAPTLAEKIKDVRKRLE
jgi:CheY-like chemotaxis protein